MDEPLSEPRSDRERRTVFCLAALILMGIVSLSFYNLDRHPAFKPPTDEFVDEVAERDPGLIFATDPVALAALERNQHRLDATIRPMMNWPPSGAVFTFGAPAGHFQRAGLEQLAQESVWSLWRSPETTGLPAFETATVEVIEPDGTARPCPRDVRGGRQCGDAGWSRVRWRELTIDGESQRCIWAHPLDEKTIRVRFPNPAPEEFDGRRLWLETALRDAAVGTGVPVEFTVRSDGDTLHHRQPDRPGWHRRPIPIDDGADELIVEISAQNVGRRHVCFRLDLQ